jgi:hypothetical protein
MLRLFPRGGQAMTEVDWLAATDPFELLDSVEEETTQRKIRLFADACCRRISRFLAAERSRNVIDVSDLYADDLASEEQLTTTLSEADAAGQDVGILHAIGRVGQTAARAVIFLTPQLFVNDVIIGVIQTKVLTADATPASEAMREADRAELEAHASLLRDIFGNPFRPVTLNPDWLTSTAVALAKQMYESRDFSAMPILADALQDTGCDNDDILNHCRERGQHVRGCWVVDLVLGKE